MYRRVASGTLFLLGVLHSAAQLPSSDPAPGLVLKSNSRVVQLEVSVDDPSGHSVHGLQKKDFVVTDNGRPRDLQIFDGEIDANRTALAFAGAAPGVYSNRLGLPDSRMATAIVIDAVVRPDGLQSDAGGFGQPNVTPAGLAPRQRPEVSLAFARAGARRAIYRMEPGLLLAIYAACPDLRVVQDYTNDPDRLLASLDAFVFPRVPDGGGKKQMPAIDALVPPMLSALRGVAARMSGATGRKSVVWVSQAYGTELNVAAIRAATDSTVTRFNDANVSLYAVDTRFNPTCEPPSRSDIEAGLGRMAVQTPTCSQPWDISDDWMDALAAATGGRAFGGGKVDAVQEREADGKLIRGSYRLDRDDAVGDALLLAIDDSRNTYELGFYVPDSELDGKVHMLSVTIPGKPKYTLRYRRGYTATANPPAPAVAQVETAPGIRQELVAPRNPDEVGIDASIDIASKGPRELLVSLALDPATVTSAADGVIRIDETFTETDSSGKQLAKIQETVPVPSPEEKQAMVRYTRPIKLSKGAVLLHVTIRDEATNRIGSLAIPIGKQ